MQFTHAINKLTKPKHWALCIIDLIKKYCALLNTSISYAYANAKLPCSISNKAFQNVFLLSCAETHNLVYLHEDYSATLYAKF